MHFIKFNVTGSELVSSWAPPSFPLLVVHHTAWHSHDVVDVSATLNTKTTFRFSGYIDPRFPDLDTISRWMVSFTPRPPYPGAHRIGGWVGPRAGLDDVERRNWFGLPGLELQTLGHAAHSQSLYRQRYVWNYTTKIGYHSYLPFLRLKWKVKAVHGDLLEGALQWIIINSTVICCAEIMFCVACWNYVWFPHVWSRRPI
jgi:hypothetical protein